MLLLLLGVAAAIAMLDVLVRRRAPQPAIAWCVAAPLVLLLLLARGKDAYRYELLIDGTVLHPTAKYWVSAARLIDDVTSSRRVALTSGPELPSIWFSYYFLGRSLQNRLSYVSPLPGDEIPAFHADADWRSRAEFDLWHDRLRQRGIREVMSFTPPSIELRWMEERPKLFERVVGAPGAWGLFRLR